MVLLLQFPNSNKVVLGATEFLVPGAPKNASLGEAKQAP